MAEPESANTDQGDPSEGSVNEQVMKDETQEEQSKVAAEMADEDSVTKPAGEEGNAEESADAETKDELSDGALSVDDPSKTASGDKNDTEMEGANIDENASGRDSNPQGEIVSDDAPIELKDGAAQDVVKSEDVPDEESGGLVAPESTARQDDEPVDDEQVENAGGELSSEHQPDVQEDAPVEPEGVLKGHDVEVVEDPGVPDEADPAKTIVETHDLMEKENEDENNGTEVTKDKEDIPDVDEGNEINQSSTTDSDVVDNPVNSATDSALDNPTTSMPAVEDIKQTNDDSSSPEPVAAEGETPLPDSAIEGGEVETTETKSNNETSDDPTPPGDKPEDAVDESNAQDVTQDQGSANSEEDAPDSEPVKSASATSRRKSSEKVVSFEDDVELQPGEDDGEHNIEEDLDVSKSPTSTIRELAPSRNSATNSEFVYDENEDFKTPEFYDRCLQQSATPDPSITESEKMRQEAGSRRNLMSRGAESGKSVTFADEVMSQDGGSGGGVDDDEGKEEGVIAVMKEEGGEGDGEIEGGDAGKDEETAETDKPASAEPESVFATAVSEETIEEATARAKGKGVDTQSVAVDLWGQSKFELQSMGDVVNKRAIEHFEKGCKLADQGDHCHAILCFDKAINLNPKTTTYYLARGESYIQICDFQSAILNLKRACVLDPNSNINYSKLAFVYYFFGQTLFDQNLFAEALEAFSRASEMRPEVVGYHTRSVACLAALQRHGECLALVNKRLETEQENPDLYIMRARLHELFRNTSLCYYDLKDALALDPDLEEALMLMKRLEVKAQESRNLCVTLQLQGKLKDALNKITTAIETNPSKAEYHLLRGALHRRLADYNAAIDDYLLALDKTEHNENDNIYTESQRQLLLTYNDFAVECFLGKHYEEAIILLNKALKGEKREKGLYVNRGDCFFRLNELHFALADYHQALELDAYDWMTRSRIASIHSEFGLMDYEEHNYQEAEARFVVAIQHNPRKGSYYVNRAKVRFMLENLTEARQDLLMALHLDPNNDEILALMPRLFPGKAVGDVMRSREAKMAKMAIDNAVVTASPVKLPVIRRENGIKNNLQQTTQQNGNKSIGGSSKHVAFAANGLPPHLPSSPDVRECMNEMQFNKVLTKKKNKISSNVKTLLHDRKTLSTSPVTLAPQPPPRPYTVKGGGWKKDDTVDTSMGWKTFTLGMGVMNK